MILMLNMIFLGMEWGFWLTVDQTVDVVDRVGSSHLGARGGVRRAHVEDGLVLISLGHGMQHLQLRLLLLNVLLTLLNAQRTWQQARISLVQAEATRYSDTAALFQALGGGWWHRTDVVLTSATPKQP